MEHKPCKTIIKNKYPHMTGTGKRIADYILSHEIDFTNLSVGKFAEKCSVAGSAVMRFCQMLGFEGYADFKINMAMETAFEKPIAILPDIHPGDDNARIINTVFNSAIKTLQDTLKMIDVKQFSEVVEKLHSARHIYIYAMGTSIPVANDMQYRLMQLGYTAFCISDVSTMQITTMNFTKSDIVVAISNSGRTTAIIDIVKKAKNAGLECMCITSYSESSLAKLCSYALTAYSDENKYPTEAVSARLAHISIIDAVIVALSSKDFENAAKRTEKTAELLGGIRYEE